LQVALCLLVESITGHALTPLERAHLCQEAEERFAGVPCGIMDPLASSLAGSAGPSALLIDCQDESVTPIAFDEQAACLVVSDCGLRHDLGDGAYAERRAECDQAARLLGARSLREAADQGGAELDLGRLPEPLAARARHVLGENARTRQAAAALARGDHAALGALMYESHRSLREDFAVSTPELDALVAAAEAIGAAGGVHGARLTGGGFGGCTLTLARAERAEEVCQGLAAEYARRTGRPSQPFVVRPAVAPVAFCLDEVEI
jgi:galactokinase